MLYFQSNSCDYTIGKTFLSFMILPSFDHTIKWRAKHFRVMEETTLDSTILNTPVKMICTAKVVVALKVRFFKAFMAFFPSIFRRNKKAYILPCKDSRMICHLFSWNNIVKLLFFIYMCKMLK